MSKKYSTNRTNYIWIFLILILLVIILPAYIYFNSAKIQSSCAKLGEQSFNDATGEKKLCCQGLEEVSNGCVEYDPSDSHAYKNGCIFREGCGSICSNTKCGNSICESPIENRCTCPKDCQVVSNYTCPNAKSIDCMPSISGDKKDYCDWVGKNCPGIVIAV